MTVSATNNDHALRALIADLAQTSRELVNFRRRLDEQGIDSLHLIVLRERLQEALAWTFTDEAWASVRTPADILAALTATEVPTLTASEVPSRNATPSPSRSSGSSGVASTRWSTSLATDEIEIGMPLTGRNNLAETPLLQYLGDQRWRHISHAMGIPSREIRDDSGERLYATFFYVEVAFPESKPMAAFGENDRFKIVSTLARYGTSMLDGTSYLLPVSDTHRAQEAGDVPFSSPFSSVGDAVAAGVPAVRLSNIFVRQFAGAEWLKKGRPAHPGFARIQALAEAPDTSVWTKQAEQSGQFGSRGSGWIAMTDGPVKQDYRLVPDRDLNGAGLVYFANYPMFLDICERAVLLSARLPLSEGLLDRRTIVHRQSAYLNNASSTDTLRIEIEPWIHERDLARVKGGETADVRLHINGRMYRRSDDRLMMVSTALKVVRGVSLDDVPFASLLSSASR